MITLVLPGKIRLKLTERDAEKLYHLAEGDADVVRFSDDWGMDALAFRTRHSIFLYYYSQEENEHRLIELDVFDEILIRDQLEFALVTASILGAAYYISTHFNIEIDWRTLALYSLLLFLPFSVFIALDSLEEGER